MFFNVASRVRDVFTVVLQLYIRIYVCIVFVCGGVNVLYAHIIVCLLFIDPMGTQKTNFSLSCWWLIIVFSLFFSITSLNFTTDTTQPLMLTAMD